MSSAQKIIQAAAGNVSGAVEPVGIDFDATNDYLSRSSDLTGNTDSKTFTFSAWVYNVNGGFVYHVNPEPIASRTVYVNISSSSDLQFFAQNTSGSTTLFFTCADVIPENTFSHILISIDLSNTSNRYVYINDVDKTSSVVWSTYSNNNINFTQPGHGIGGDSLNASFDGRLAGVYLDYTYRDLSVEANRRDFIDADLKYVTPPTSGIISVPMDDPADPGRNDGTGGDFTLNGVVAQSDRGPNQYNAAASTFDGSADYLTLSYTTASTKAITCSFVLKKGSNSEYVGSIDPGGNTKFQLLASFGGINVRAWNSSSTEVLQIQSNTTDLVPGKYFSIQISLDLSDTSKRQILINGVSQSLTVTTYTNDNMYLQGTFNIGALNGGALPFEGQLSDFWWNESYTADLSGFYDTETGKPKDLGVNGELPTGSSPLIYLPLRADNAGDNRGTGGDFTVNSGPYQGARGPSEYWASSVSFGGSASNYLSKSSLTGASDGTVFSVALAMYRNTESGTQRLVEFIDGSTYRVGVHANASSFELVTRNSGGTIEALIQTSTTSLLTSQWYILLACFDTANSNNCKVYVYYNSAPNGQNQSFSTFGSFAGNNASFTSAVTINTNTSNSINGAIGQVYFDNRYIDFSQESNRLKFVDAFGYMKDLSVEIENENIDSPLIYVPFSNASNFGQNLGTGGNFTVNGTVNDFGYVDINS